MAITCISSTHVHVGHLFPSICSRVIHFDTFPHQRAIMSSSGIQLSTKDTNTWKRRAQRWSELPSTGATDTQQFPVMASSWISVTSSAEKPSSSPGLGLPNWDSGSRNWQKLWHKNSYSLSGPDTLSSGLLAYNLSTEIQQHTTIL